jgi:hypothetical protein
MPCWPGLAGAHPSCGRAETQRHVRAVAVAATVSIPSRPAGATKGGPPLSGLPSDSPAQTAAASDLQSCTYAPVLLSCRRCFPLPRLVVVNLSRRTGARMWFAPMPRMMPCCLALFGARPVASGARLAAGLEPPTTQAGSGAHLSCKRAALPAHKCDLPRRGGDQGRRQRPRAGRGGVGQPDTLPRRPASLVGAWKHGREGRGCGVGPLVSCLN